MASPITVRIIGDVSGLKSSVDAADGQVGRLEGFFKRAAGVAGGLFAGVQVGQLIGDVVAAGSDLNETQSKARTIFGESADAIDRWAEGAAAGFGQSRQQALDAAATFGNLFSQLGVGADQSAAMSQAMVELASDFASFHNANPVEVIEAQTAAFRGEYDALQRFVPTINAASVEQKALAMTGKTATSALTAQEKALAVNALMMENAGAAAGDFERTSDSLANKQRILGARFADVQAELGEKLLPAAVAVADFILTKVVPAFEGFGQAVGRVAEVFKEQGFAGVVETAKAQLSELLPQVLSVIQGAVEGIGAWLVENGPGMLRGLRDAWLAWVQFLYTEFYPKAFVAVGELLAGLGDWIVSTAAPQIVAWLETWGRALADWVEEKAWPYLQAELPVWLGKFATWVLGTALPAVVTWSAQLATAFVRWVQDTAVAMPGHLEAIASAIIGWAPGATARAAAALADLGYAIARAIVNPIARAWNNLSLTLGGGSYDPLGKYGPTINVPSFTISTPNVPLLATGAVLTRPTLFIGGEGGEPEIVTPESKMRQVLRSEFARLGTSRSEPVVLMLDSKVVARAQARRERGLRR